ncbi:non-ribosomal peptide synthetase [Nonomuraea coxensis]|uniref:non-ribosomal peptide synthetase/MFS transporter n=1 Tax=Nonomuraea coxensis TaxID=404386 RepID=UPI0003755001|nr:non-ribosomal peptide synthetase [Nonomuraea coxensis]
MTTLSSPGGLSPAKQALLAQRLRRRAAATTVPPRPPGTPPPLSHAQERLWFLEQYAPGTAAYTVSCTARVTGELDEGALRRAVREVAARHESLRSRFATAEDGTPRLVIDAEPAPEFLVAAAGTPEKARALVSAELARPFDLAAGPLLRVLLIRLGPAEAGPAEAGPAEAGTADDHVLMLAAHHAVADGWSWDVVLGELFTLLAGREPEPLPVQYGDYALWQRERTGSAAYRADVDYWRAQLAGVPALELPTDLPRPAEQTFTGAAYGFRLDAEQAGAVRALAEARGATPYMVLLAAFQALLGRWSGQSSFAVGSPVSGRGLPELDGLVGMFVNTLALRADLSGDPSFDELVGRVRETALDAFAHQELPFDQLVGELNVTRDVSRPAVFQVMFALQNYTARPVDAGPLELEWFHADTVASRFDLSLYLHGAAGGGLDGTFVYNTALFEAGTVERMAESLEALLRSAVAAPGTPVSGLEILTEAGRARLAALETAAPPAPPEAELLHELVFAQAGRTPDATAVVFGGTRLTYRELAGRARRLAAHLRARGVRPGDRVAVCLEQSAGVAVALLGVLAAGAAYVPLDPAQPAGRLAYLVEDAGVRTVITSGGAREALPGGLTEIDPDRVPGGDAPVAAGIGPSDLAYVIYTSGTTGRPKGVAVQHREVVTYLAGVRERFGVEPGASFALPQSLAFDFGVTVFYLALMTGGRLDLLPSRTSARELAEHFRESPADYLKITPSHLAALLGEAGPGELLPRRLLILGGEASSWAWARELAAYEAPGRGRCAVVNHYGPTEATVGITTYAVDPERPAGETTLPIGRPLPGARVRVLDERLRPVPVGVVGEICLGGDRLARGYLGRPALTAERFVPDPDGPPGSRLYRTGDLGRWLPDGTLRFLGRRDLQVKIRGYRVELGEVESVLAEFPGVAQAVAELRGDRLVGYLLPVEGGARAPAAEVRAWLRERLPDYMIPARYVWLDHLPLKSHGKVDRGALPDPEDDRPDGGAAFVPPDGPAEEAVAAVWADVLGLARVGALDDFFELGGHSLLAMRVLARLRRIAPERRVTLMDLFKHTTVRETAALLAGEERAREGDGGLLHRLTPARATTAATLVCAPYGGGSAVIYQPLADALPGDWALYSLAVPGHELGEEAMPPEEVARRCAEEILAGIEGPVVLYGHCGLGAMITAETARLLHDSGREVEAVYLGGIFPFARPGGRMARLRDRLDDLRGDQGRINALTAAGLDVSDLSPEELRLIVRNRREGTRAAERYFTRLFEEERGRLGAPVIAVAGERDPIMEFYQERFREWHVLSPVTACAVLDEAAHFFVKYRAGELAEIVTRTHAALATGETATLERGDGGRTWWLEGVSHESSAGGARAMDVPAAEARAAAGIPPRSGAAGMPPRGGPAGLPGRGGAGGPRPSMRRFFAVAAGQAVSIVGSALTEFAVPLWIYLTTDSLVDFALFSVLALVPGMVVAPLAGTIVDRSDRRRVMLLGDAGAFGTQLLLGLLLWTGNLQVWHIYPLLVGLSVALAFQRVAYQSAVPQLVPKRFLGHANGVVGMINGVAQLVVPLAAAGLMSLIGLEGILVLDVVSYAIAIVSLLLIRFPATMALRRRETVAAELVNGLRYSWGNKGFRRMVTFFAVVNLFMAALFLMISPLVLSSGTIADVGRVSFAGGLGVFLGGLVMAVWGGPRVRRFRGQLMFTLTLALSAVVIGARPDLVVVTAGVFGLFLSLTLLNGVYTTIVQVKIPQRYHGRVFALNQLVAFSTLPIGYAVVAPLGTSLLEPLLADGGALADTVGRVIGTGEGRGIGLLYVLLGAAIAACVLVARRRRVLWDFDALVPDALPDDLIGFQALRERGAPVKEDTWTTTRS